MYIIIYDFGTSSVKTCLYEIDAEIKLVAGSAAPYGLYISDDGGAEQDTEGGCRTADPLFAFVRLSVIRATGNFAAGTPYMARVSLDKALPGRL